MNNETSNESKRSLQGTEPIVFFDGVCGLCNSVVDQLIEIDHARRLRYAPLQGRTAQNHLVGLVPQHEVDDLKSIIFYKQNRVYLRSDAVIEILVTLGMPWALASLAKLIPQPIRDRLYQFVASHRYQWFGKRETCRIPTKEERQLFLD